MRMSSIDFCKINSIENESSCINSCHRKEWLGMSNIELLQIWNWLLKILNSYFSSRNLSRNVYYYFEWIMKKLLFTTKKIEIGKCQLDRTLIIFCCKWTLKSLRLTVSQNICKYICLSFGQEKCFFNSTPFSILHIYIHISSTMYISQFSSSAKSSTQIEITGHPNYPWGKIYKSLLERANMHNT